MTDLEELLKEGEALYANREAEPSDWGDWADENCMTVIGFLRDLVTKSGRHHDQLDRLEERLTRCSECGRALVRACSNCDDEE